MDESTGSFRHYFNGYPTPANSSESIRFREAPTVNDEPIPFNIQNYFQSGSRRHRRVRRPARDNILSAANKPTIRRLARRGGVKRIKMEIYPTVQQVMYERLKEMIRLTVAVCESRGKKTITTLDVVYALRTMGNPIYGCGTIVHGEEVGSRAEYMRQRRAGYAENRARAQAELEREQHNQRIDQQVRRLGGSVNVLRSR